MDWRKRADQILAQSSPGTNSKRPDQFILGVYPTSISQGHSCYVWDWKSNRYIDFIGSLGANLFGHNFQPLSEALHKQIYRGITFSLPTDLELEVAEMLKSMMPFIDKVRFLKTGSEACQAAIRFARASNKNATVYSRGYHGWHDMFTSLTSPAAGIPNINYQISTKEENQEIAIIEPIELEDSTAVKKELLRMRNAHKILIFDEIITGMRVPNHCVANYYNIAPDIICLGKAIANGMPLSLVAGRKEILDNPDVFVSSTFSGECLSLVACRVVLSNLLKRNISELWERGKAFLTMLNGALGEIGVKIDGYGTRGMLDTSSYQTALFMQEACKGGLLFGKAYFYTFAHMDENIEEYTMSVIYDVINKIKNGKVKLEGQLPNPGFKRYEHREHHLSTGN